MSESDSDGREKAQKTTFTRWCNHFLMERMLKINDLYMDLNDGLMLINLLELISAKSFAKYNKKPKMAIHKTENITAALEFIEKEGLKLVNIGSQDIMDGTPKLILGLIWTLILRYQIQLGGSTGSPKALLLEWVNKQIKPYSPEIPPATNFTSSFADGKVLNALADSLSPGLIPDCRNLSNPLQDAQQALDKSEEAFSIPPLMDAYDIVNNPDDHSMMTYVSYFRDYLENKAKNDENYRLHGPDPSKCYAVGKGVEGGFSGRPVQFTIYSVRSNGEPVLNPKYKGEFCVDIKDPQSNPVPVTVTDNNDGTLTGVYTALTPGQYYVDIEVEIAGPNAPIQGSQYKPLMRPGSDPSQSWAEGPGLTQAFDDMPATFTVHCLDSNGQYVIGEDELACTIELKQAGAPTSAASSSGGFIEVTREETPKFCEECGVVLTGDKFCTDCGTKIVPRKVTVRQAAPPGASAAPSALTSVVSGAAKVFPEIKDNNDGTYKVTYLAPVAGQYEVLVTIVNAPIKDMPSQLTVYPGIDASKTTAEGRGVGKVGFLGRAHPFTVRTKDRSGNPVVIGGGDIQTAVAGPANSTVPCNVVDKQDGTYDGNYTPTALGPHVVDIKIGDRNGRGSPIFSNPFPINIIKGADPEKSFAEGEGVNYAMDNRPGLFTVHAFDEDGKPVVGEWVDVLISNPDNTDAGFPVEIKDNGDGTYGVKYDADKPGQYVLDVKCGDQSIKDMPHAITVHPGVDPSKSIVTGPGVEGGNVNRPLDFTIKAIDKNGNPVTVGGETILPTVTGNGKPLPCNVVDNKDGTYTGTYTANEPVPHQVALVLQSANAHIGKSPYTVPVKANGDCSKSYAKGKGYRYAYDNETASFLVYVNDSEGAPVTGELLQVVIKETQDTEDKTALQKLISLVDPYMIQKKNDEIAKRRAESGQDAVPEGSDLPVKITDNKDGTYLVEYIAFIAGKHTINVMIDGQHISNSPNTIPVYWSCPNAPCRHTTEQLRDEVNALKKEMAALKAENANLKGQTYVDGHDFD